MSRYIVLCIDGTWNARVGHVSHSSRLTNVGRIFEHLSNDGDRQVVKYLPGVGTRGPLDRILRGVWGGGITDRVRQGYEYLCQNHRPGDRIGLFGFSRGAFAVRAIVGLVANFGLLLPEHSNKIDHAISLYRKPRIRWTSDNHDFRRKCDRCLAREARVTFIGVWDTVIRFGPMGIPLRFVLQSMLATTFGLFDRRVPACVDSVCHALALDECRAAFWPWRFEKDADYPGNLNQEIEELWFVGSHSDVGGGNPDSRLADIALCWIFERAKKAEIEFGSTPAVTKDAHLAPIQNASRGIWRVFPPKVRVFEPGDQFHSSVRQRARAMAYAPKAAVPDHALP